MKAKGYSLWLIPKEEDIFKKLSNIVSTLSEEHGSPNFLPHVTLIGGIIGTGSDILEKTKTLASLINPYEVSLGDIGHSDEYFKSLFVHIEETPFVIDANKKAQDIFCINKIYKPHLSLFYGDLNQEEKDLMFKKILHADFKSIHFRVEELHLYHTNGVVDEWKEV